MVVIELTSKGRRADRERDQDAFKEAKDSLPPAGRDRDATSRAAPAVAGFRSRVKAAFFRRGMLRWIQSDTVGPVVQKRAVKHLVSPPSVRSVQFRSNLKAPLRNDSSSA